MASIKSPKQLKEEHPDWTHEQVFHAFDTSLTRKIKGVRNDLQGIKEILETDPMWKKDGWAQWYSEFIRRAIALLNPDFGAPFDMEDESITPEQEAVYAEYIKKT